MVPAPVVVRNIKLIELERFAGRFVPIGYAFCALMAIALIAAFASFAELVGRSVNAWNKRGGPIDARSAMVVHACDQSVVFLSDPSYQHRGCVAISVCLAVFVACIDIAALVRRVVDYARTRVLELTVKTVLLAFIWFACARAIACPIQC